MSKFKPGDMAKTKNDARFPTWSNRTVCIVGLIDIGLVPGPVRGQHPYAKEWYEIELIDGVGAPSLANSYLVRDGSAIPLNDETQIDGIVCPDTHLIPLNPPKDDHIPSTVRELFTPKREKVKA